MLKTIEKLMLSTSDYLSMRAAEIRAENDRKLEASMIAGIYRVGEVIGFQRGSVNQEWERIK